MTGSTFFLRDLVPHLYLCYSKLLIYIEFYVLYWQMTGGDLPAVDARYILGPLIIRGFLLPLSAFFGF